MLFLTVQMAIIIVRQHNEIICFMEKANSRKIIGNILIFLAIFTFFIPIIPIGGFWLYDEYRTECNQEQIKHESVTIEDSTIDLLKSYTKVIGKDGLRKICKNGHNRELSNTIITNAINNVYVRGTYIKPYVAPTYTAPQYYSSGSTCMDGAHSNSTGRGTCSWHGGVAY